VEHGAVPGRTGDGYWYFTDPEGREHVELAGGKIKGAAAPGLQRERDDIGRFLVPAHDLENSRRKRAGPGCFPAGLSG
jgi:hypothetical protein